MNKKVQDFLEGLGHHGELTREELLQYVELLEKSASPSTGDGLAARIARRLREQKNSPK